MVHDLNEVNDRSIAGALVSSIHGFTHRPGDEDARRHADRESLARDADG
jgi:hypothetical protein